MATDSLNQLGKHLGKTSRDIKQTTRYISKNLPEIEKTEDIFGAINTFRFEFKTYKYNASVSLNLTIKPKFKVITRKGYG